MVVFPGGGYQELAIDLEGSEICDWLTDKGMTCVLLKYRVPEPRSRPYWGAYPESPMALEVRRYSDKPRERSRHLKLQILP